MEALKFLQQVEHWDTITKNLLIERKQWEELAYTITAQMGGERVQASGGQQKMADALNKCVDMEMEIDQKVAMLAAKKREVTNTIERLSTTHYNVLHMKYIQYLSFFEIADANGRDYNWATTIHGRAKKSLQGLLDERKQNANDT